MITFRYADATSSLLEFGNTQINPNPTKTVSSIEFAAAANSPGWSITVRNAKAVTPSPASVTISLSPQLSNWTSFRVPLLGAREAGDVVSFAITNGSTTLSNLSFDTLHTWTGASAPTSLTLSLTPSVNASIGGTTANTVGVFFNP